MRHERSFLLPPLERSQRGPGGPVANHVQNVESMSTAIRKFIPHIPTPSRDHRQYEATRLLEQHMIDPRIEHADLVWRMGNVELDGTSAARLEIDEEQAVSSNKQVAGVRLAVKQLLGVHAAAHRLPPAAQCV